MFVELTRLNGTRTPCSGSRRSAISARSLAVQPSLPVRQDPDGLVLPSETVVSILPGDRIELATVPRAHLEPLAALFGADDRHVGQLDLRSRLIDGHLERCLVDAKARSG